jgi:hypothetical protein
MLIKHYVNNAEEAMFIVRQLRSSGFVQGVDFDFQYHPESTDYNDFTVLDSRHVIFNFYKQELATWFSLKWL